MKILVIQQKMIGDVLTSTIICEALKKKYPNSTIHYLINSNTKAMVLHNPYIDKIVEFIPLYRENKIDFYKFLVSIREEKYDCVYDVYNKLESYLITAFSGAQKKFGQDKWYSKLLFTDFIKNKEISITNAGLAVENRLRFVYEEEEISKNIIAPKLYLTEEEIVGAKKKYINPLRLEASQKIVMIGVLGSEKKKSLPPKTMAQLIDTVAKRNVAIFFNYAPHQKEEVNHIYELIQPESKEKVYFDVFASSLREFLALMKNCDVLIGNEGGAVNMAKALNKPTFSIFSPWIKQEGWNLFEDGLKHKSIHLKQFKPAIYTEYDNKQLKENALELYKEFEFHFIEKELIRYMNNLSL